MKLVVMFSFHRVCVCVCVYPSYRKETKYCNHTCLNYRIVFKSIIHASWKLQPHIDDQRSLLREISNLNFLDHIDTLDNVNKNRNQGRY